MERLCKSKNTWRHCSNSDTRSIDSDLLVHGQFPVTVGAALEVYYLVKTS